MQTRTLTLSALLAAATLSSTATAQTSALTANYDHIHRTTLPNGLEVVVVEAPALPIVTIEIAVQNGAFTEPPELNGLSHLYEHMFFKANATIPSQEEYMAEQRRLGMVWNGTTGTERVNYFFTLQSHNVRPGLEFMAAAIRAPLFLEEELVKEREVVIGEFDRNEASPGYHMGHALDRMLWWQHPSRKDPLGDRPTILSATVEQMQWMQNTYYVPNNSLLVLSGDITAEEGFALAEDILGDWEPGLEPFDDYPVPEHPAMPETSAAIVAQPIQVSAVALAWHGPDTRNDIEATYAADVFSFALSQPGSTFQRNLVDSGLALDAGISYSTQRYTGQIQLTAITLPGNEEQLINALMEEIERFDDEGYVTPEQITTAQMQLAVDDLYTQQSTTDLAHTISYWWASADIDYYLNYINNLNDVTADAMRDYVTTYIQDRPMAAVLMTDESVVSASGLSADWLLNLVTAGGSDAE